jgi:carbon storage regulator
MLVLTRKSGQKVVLGGGITITVVEVKGSQVRLAFDAPDQVRIVRGELVVQTEDPDQEPHDADLEAKPAEWRGTTQRRAQHRLAGLACSR